MSRRDDLVSSRHAYGVLLLVILASLTFQLAAPDRAWSRLVAIALQGVTLVLALRVSGTRTLITHAATIVVGIGVVLAIAALIGFGEGAHASGRAVNLLLVALAPVAIAAGVVREVGEQGAITIRTMFGVLCIYLLVGLLFATGFGLIGDVSSRSFFASGISATQSDYLYFSFATITTVGYGDLTAATDLGRSLAITEALVGQIYLVTVVAVIVSNLGRARA